MTLELCMTAMMYLPMIPTATTMLMKMAMSQCMTMPLEALGPLLKNGRQTKQRQVRMRRQVQAQLQGPFILLFCSALARALLSLCYRSTSHGAFVPSLTSHIMCLEASRSLQWASRLEPCSEWEILTLPILCCLARLGISCVYVQHAIADHVVQHASGMIRWTCAQLLNLWQIVCRGLAKTYQCLLHMSVTCLGSGDLMERQMIYCRCCHLHNRLQTEMTLDRVACFLRL